VSPGDAPAASSASDVSNIAPCGCMIAERSGAGDA
jgi:hypothetical protein